MGAAVRSTTAALARGAEAGALLLGALVASALYAALAGGAARLAQEVWLQAALAVLALLVGVAWLAGGRVAVTAPRAAWAGVGLLAGFAAWSGLTLAWSVAPDRTWLATNRALGYAVVAALAVVAGATARRAVERWALGLLGVACTVALVALAGKVAPGLTDTTALTGRLRAPLGYWNALAAICVFGVPPALRVATDLGRGVVERLGGLAACWLLLLVLLMTYSRGGVLALLTALAVVTALGEARARGLGAVALAVACAVPGLAVAFGDPALRGDAVPLDDRVPAGLRLAVALGVGLVVLLAAGRLWLAREDRMLERGLPPRLAQRALRAAFVLGVVLVVAVAATEQGLDGALDDQVERFTSVPATEVGDPGRLGEASSGNRWAWWKEAAGAWADRPLGGWGAGSFPVVHRLFRQDLLDVNQPHDVPLQWLAETGLVGLLLAVGGLGLLGAAAVVRVRGLLPGRERELAVALLAVVAAWAVHALFEWHWDIPGVTVPALVALGVLAARPSDPRSGVRRLGAFVEADDRAAGLRTSSLVPLTLACAAFLVSSALPALADARASAAQAAASRARTDAARARAAATAELAVRLDPLAVRPLLAVAAVADGRDRRREARDALLEAVRRQPYSAVAWARLAETSLELADRRGAARAARRWLELDPASLSALRTTQATLALLAPPSASPTATGTPLPAVPAAVVPEAAATGATPPGAPATPGGAPAPGATTAPGGAPAPGATTTP